MTDDTSQPAQGPVAKQDAMMGSATEFIRAITRPVLTGMGLGAWIVFIAYGVSYPAPFEAAVLGMLALWFGPRAVQALK